MENELTYVRKNQPIEDGKISKVSFIEENIENNQNNQEELKGDKNDIEGFKLKKFKNIPSNDNIYSLKSKNSLNYFSNDTNLENNKYVTELKSEIEKERKQKNDAFEFIKKMNKNKSVDSIDEFFRS